MAREKQRYGYNGNEEIDGGDLTLMDFNARIYNPSLGRFMGADALASIDAATSPYGFASNNPVNLVDPTGLYNRGWFEQSWYEYDQAMSEADKDYYGPNPLGFNSSSGRYRRTHGSGYHWGDQFKSVEWNAMTMSESTFRNFYGLNDGFGGTNYERAGQLANNLVASGAPGTAQYSIGVNGLGDGSGNIIPGTEVYILYEDRSNANGGMTDFTNSNHALNIGAGIYGAMQGLTSSQGYWLGENGKYYSTSWGGNQRTGSRAGALKAANTYKLAGKAVVVGQVVIGGYATYEGYVADGGEFGYNAQRAAVGSGASILGGIAGAQAGAAAGASIGAWVGGVGAIPGAVIGGVIGGFGLGVGGSYFGGYLGESAVDYYHGR